MLRWKSSLNCLNMSTQERSNRLHSKDDSPEYFPAYETNPRMIAVADRPAWCDLCADPEARLMIEGREDRTYCIQCIDPEVLPVWVVVQYSDRPTYRGRPSVFLADAKSGQVASRLEPSTWSDMDRARQYAIRHGGSIAWVIESGEVRFQDGSPVGGL